MTAKISEKPSNFTAMDKKAMKKKFIMLMFQKQLVSHNWYYVAFHCINDWNIENLQRKD